MAERFPQDFRGAAPQGIEIVCLSSDDEEEMDDLSITSVLDLQLTSEDEENDDEIMMMTQCVEIELSTPIPVPGPSTSNFRSTNLQNKPSRRETPKPDYSPQPIFDQSFFFGQGEWPNTARRPYTKQSHS